MALMKMTKEFLFHLQINPDLDHYISNYFEKIEFIGTENFPITNAIFRVNHPDLEPGDYYIDMILKLNEDGIFEIAGLEKIEE